MAASGVQLLSAATLWMIPRMNTTAVLLGSTEVLNTTRAAAKTHCDFRMLARAVGVSRSRHKRAISPSEMNALLDYHNRVRSQVLPPAANKGVHEEAGWERLPVREGSHGLCVPPVTEAPAGETSAHQTQKPEDITEAMDTTLF